MSFNSWLSGLKTRELGAVPVAVKQERLMGFAARVKYARKAFSKPWSGIMLDKSRTVDPPCRFRGTLHLAPAADTGAFFLSRHTGTQRRLARETSIAFRRCLSGI
jgi:hypothetical protein